MSAAADARETPAWASCFPVAALGAWAFLRIGTWFARDYTHDDFYFAYLSWLRSVKAIPGVDTDIFLYTPLVELFSPFFRLWPESFLPLDIGRGFILVIAFGLLGTVFIVSRRLGASVPWALCAVSFTAWQRDFLLRISDVRTDPIATLFLLAVFLCLLNRDVSRPLLGGLCFGMAVFFNVKLAVAVPALGFLVAATSPKTPIRALARFAAGGAIGTVLWDGLRSLSDGWGPIVTGLKALLSAPPAGNAPQTVSFLHRAVANSPVSALLLVLGAFATIAVPLFRSNGSGILTRASDPRVTYGLAAFLFVAVYIWANPFLFPYNFVVLMPVLAPLLPGISTLFPQRFSRVAGAALVALATLVPVSESVFVLSATSDRTNLAQRRLVEWIWAATDPAEHVFDWQGMHWGRHGIHHWWMFSGWLPAYKAGAMYSVADELKASRVALVIDNYRLGWFGRTDREFFATHYARLDYCLFAPGREFSAMEIEGGGALDIFVPGIYRLDPPDAVLRVLVDGRPAARLMRLDAGVHRVTRASNATTTAAKIVFTTERREKTELPCPAPTTLFYGF